MVLGFIPSSSADNDDSKPDEVTDKDTTEQDVDESDEGQQEPKTEPAKANPLGALETLFGQVKRVVLKVWDNPAVCLLRIAAGAYLLKEHLQPKAQEFYDFSHSLADGLSQPSIMFQANLQNGERIIVDDYREAYHWLRDKTPEDSRVMAWWDYGYQITGIGNRTTIADGNTWNHEHMRRLAGCFQRRKSSHRIAKHLADYVLVWAGGGGDDLAKSPHMAHRQFVYGDICPGDQPALIRFLPRGSADQDDGKRLLYKMCLRQPG